MGQTIRSPAETEDFLRSAIGNLQSERFCAIFLDSRHRVIAFEVLFSGTIDGTSVYPREVVKRALELNAAALILAHNHPSGASEPSQADERITMRLKAALELIDVRVLDHIIVGSNQSTSLASRGLL
jgi:DNA repair protein RadC